MLAPPSNHIAGTLLCKPAELSDKCQNCKHWVDNPKLVILTMTSIVSVSRYKAKACFFKPISLL